MEGDIRTAVILAGGLGTRLRPLTDTIPKPLLPIKGKPIVQYAIENLERLSFLFLNINNITDIQPLVDNEKINEFEKVYIGNNPLDSGDCENLQKLINRGVELYHNIPCDIPYGVME